MTAEEVMAAVIALIAAHPSVGLAVRGHALSSPPDLSMVDVVDRDGKVWAVMIGDVTDLEGS